MLEKSFTINGENAGLTHLGEMFRDRGDGDRGAGGDFGDRERTFGQVFENLEPNGMREGFEDQNSVVERSIHTLNWLE